MSRQANTSSWGAMLALTLVLLAVGLLQGATAGGASTLSDRKLAMLITALQTDSIIIAASDMGVQHFEFGNLTVTQPGTESRITFNLHMYVKYTHWGGNGTVKGFLMADSREIPKQSEGVRIDPSFTLSTLTEPDTSEVANFRVVCYVFSYWDPPRQAAMVYGFEYTFPLPATPNHEYLLTSDMAPSQVVKWKPGRAQNALIGAGLEVPPVKPSINPGRSVYVILKPLYNFSPSLYSALIDRHLDFYQNLGVSMHVLYMRRENIPSLVLGNKRLGSLIHNGKLLIVEWDGLPEHEVWHKQYDQRIIHSHAILAFTGLDSYVMNIDLDEYLVTTKAELQDKSIQQWIETCAGSGAADAADVRVQRHHAVCKQCDRDKPESNLWSDYHLPTHPLTWYHLVNYKDVPRRRSIVNPNFMKAFYIHYGSLSPAFSSQYPEDKCMKFLHLPNMVRVREEADVVQSSYTEDHSWMGMMKRFKPLEPPPETGRKPGKGKPGKQGRRHHAHRQLAEHVDSSSWTAGTSQVADQDWGYSAGIDMFSGSMAVSSGPTVTV